MYKFYEKLFYEKLFKKKIYFLTIKWMEEINQNPPFNIRDFMDYEEIIQSLINHPTELSLFEVTCILINNKMNEKKTINNNLHIIK
jgi:hypothetical protein